MSASKVSWTANAFDASNADRLLPGIRRMVERRHDLLGPAYRLFYDDPLLLVRGEDVWLFDAEGRSYLDAYNNVASVGHCHPKVVAAIREQTGRLNTHTRYLHDAILDYTEELLKTFPDSLNNAMFTCTGSEANDLAIRVAKAHSGNIGLIVTENAYHGVTDATAQISPSLGSQVPRGPHVKTVPAPQDGDTNAGGAFAAGVEQAIAELRRDGFGVAAMFCDTIFSSDGIRSHPTDLLAGAAAVVRAAGGLFVTDEVQAGFGRTGNSMWGFQRHGIVPDMVTLGKPMGNGYPIGAVILGHELTAAFARQSRYFNTFGGNPVAVAAAHATLRVVRDERLMENASLAGEHILAALRNLRSQHACFGSIRGAGLFVAADVIGPRGERSPQRAASLVNGLRRRGVLISATGADGSVLKIRPPLTIQDTHIGYFAAKMQEALLEGE